VLAAIAAAALGCLGQSPPVHQYALPPVAGRTGAGSPGELAIALGPVSLPRYLDVPQIATRIGSSELAFDEYHRWAGSFEANVVSALSENLRSRLGTERVFTDRAASPFPIAFQVAVDFQQFEGRPGEELILRALWFVREEVAGGAADARLWSGQTTIRQPVAGRDVESLVAAHAAALGGLAEALAARIASARE
jgi:hypothetical protein